MKLLAPLGKAGVRQQVQQWLMASATCEMKAKSDANKQKVHIPKGMLKYLRDAAAHYPTVPLKQKKIAELTAANWGNPNVSAQAIQDVYDSGIYWACSLPTSIKLRYISYFRIGLVIMGGSQDVSPVLRL